MKMMQTSYRASEERCDAACTPWVRCGAVFDRAALDRAALDRAALDRAALYRARVCTATRCGVMLCAMMLLLAPGAGRASETASGGVWVAAAQADRGSGINVVYDARPPDRLPRATPIGLGRALLLTGLHGAPVERWLAQIGVPLDVVLLNHYWSRPGSERVERVFRHRPGRPLPLKQAPGYAHFMLLTDPGVAETAGFVPRATVKPPRGVMDRLRRLRKATLTEALRAGVEGRSPVRLEVTGDRRLPVTVHTRSGTSVVVCTTPCTVHARVGQLRWSLDAGSTFASNFSARVDEQGRGLRLHHNRPAVQLAGVGLMGLGLTALVAATFTLPATSGFDGEQWTQPERTFVASASLGLLSVATGAIVTFVIDRSRILSP